LKIIGSKKGKLTAFFGLLLSFAVVENKEEEEEKEEYYCNDCCSPFCLEL
jgi:hypothetical protein